MNSGSSPGINAYPYKNTGTYTHTRTRSAESCSNFIVSIIYTLSLFENLFDGVTVNETSEMRFEWKFRAYTVPPNGGRYFLHALCTGDQETNKMLSNLDR